MCGIAAIITGVPIIGSNPCRETEALPSEAKNEYGSVLLNIDDLKSALTRRGPDDLACRKIMFHFECGNLVGKFDDRVNKSQNSFICSGNTVKSSAPLETFIQDLGINEMQSIAQIDFFGAMLQFRGLSPVSQPLEDAFGNLLVYNGEIFGGINVPNDSNDLEVLLHKLERCCSSDCLDFHMNGICNSEPGKSIPDIFSSVKGPWAFIYWQEKSKTMWFGRDAFGRRSLLVHWPTCTDSRFILSSVSPHSFVEKYSGSSSLKNGLDSEMANDATNSTHEICYWEELPCGIYSIELKTSNENVNFIKEGMFGVVRKHKWTDPLLNKTISCDRFLLDPKTEYGSPIQTEQLSLPANSLTVTCSDMVHPESAQRILSALRRSVMRRTKINSIFQMSTKQCREEENAPVAVLFSGGLDSMIIAALLDQCLSSQSCS